MRSDTHRSSRARLAALLTAGLPDPNSQGVAGSLVQLGIDPNGPQFQAAEKTCTQQTGYGKGASESSGS
jgi:hypothetical protein